ncbi:MAG: SLC13 family permease [Desulfuromonadales bacterium]|nr:SLC13 family permease [Desulfuromonadales bacterium]
MQIILVLTILLVAIALFSSGLVRMDMTSVLVLATLYLTGLVSVEEAFSGFSNPAVITVAGMFVIGAGISNTGFVNRVAEKLLSFSHASETRLIISLMLTVACFSAFINNIGATAILMPVVANISKKRRIPASILLIPLAFGSLLGGVCTLIGTPPNILMNILLQQHTGERFMMFDFTPIGLIVLVTGILYMAFIGRYLLPRNKAKTLDAAYQAREYITEIEVVEGSPLAGQTISATRLEDDFNLKVRAILRDRKKIPAPRRNRKLAEKDILFLEGNPEGILKVRKKKGLEVVPEREYPVPVAEDDEVVVVEASLTPTSEAVGKTLRDLRFAETHGLTVLAIWRRGSPVVKRVDHVVLKFGDVLLLKGPEQRVVHLGKEHGYLLLGGIQQSPYNPRKAPVAVAILIALVSFAALGLLPITVAATLGALALVLTRCLTPKEAYESIDWSIIMLIAGTLPLGLAMENSGAAQLIAGTIISIVGPFGPWAVLGAVFFMTSIFTEAMSHAAAAVLIAPIALSTALELGVSPKPFYIAVAIAASSCFMTPISHQSNALVMGPGSYRFNDYLKVGAPLNLLVWIVATLTIPLLFPF